MAERRMFSKAVVMSDVFLDMPFSARCLYFTLSLYADDDGLVNAPRSIMRQCEASGEDLNALLKAQYIILFPSGVVALRHWKLNNYLRPDRYTPSKCADERAALTLDNAGLYKLAEPGDPPLPMPGKAGIPMVDQADTENSTGQKSKNKSIIGEGSTSEPAADAASELVIDYQAVLALYRSLCPQLPSCTLLTAARKKAIRELFETGYDMNKLESMFQKAGKSSFLAGENSRNWVASFDWLIKPLHAENALNGTYDDRKSRQEEKYARKAQEEMARMRRILAQMTEEEEEEVP